MLDVLIIGGGPAGLGAAIYAKRAGLSVEVYENNIYGAGQLVQVERVDNYLGLWGTNGWDMATDFLNHAKEMGVEPKEGTAKAIRYAKGNSKEDETENRRENTREDVEAVQENEWEKAKSAQEYSRKDAEVTQESAPEDTADMEENVPGHWLTEFEEGFSICSRTVIFATGAKHRKLGVPGETELTGHGVSYCATCDGMFFQGKDVAVVGGGNAALDDALYLSRICRTVYLIHRRNEFRGFAAAVSAVQKTGNIKILTPHQVTAITGEKQVEAVCLEDGTELPVSAAFLAVGMQPVSEVLRSCDLIKLDAAGYVIADETCATSAPGFFVAGDLRTKPLRQIITAVADGANAAMSAAAYIQGL